MLLQLMSKTVAKTVAARNVDTMRALYPDNMSTAERLHIHATFLLKLLGKRSSSLASFYLIPPFRYAGVLDASSAAGTLERMMDEWTLLLDLEAQDRAGVTVKPLSAMTWRLNESLLPGT